MRCMTIFALCWMLVGDAYADKPKPWEQGSTPQQREQAHKLFSQGNDLFFKRDYNKALALYEQAIGVFDHPRIRLARAEALVVLGRPADAQVQLDAALKYGAEPFDPDEHARALELQKTLANQLGTVIIKCSTEGAQLTMDGVDLMTCPGEVTRVVMPGRHQIVGKKEGFMPLTQDVLVDPAKRATADIALKPLEVAIGYTRQRRWPTWKPWAFVIGGAALGVLGAPLQWRASVNMQRFRDAVAVCGSDGCPAGDPAFDIESRAKLYNRMAIGLWILGGGAAATGLAGVYLNREKLVPTERPPGVVFAPTITSTGVVLTLAGEL